MIALFLLFCCPPFSILPNVTAFACETERTGFCPQHPAYTKSVKAMISYAGVI